MPREKTLSVFSVIRGDDNYPTRVVSGGRKHTIPAWLADEIERLQDIEQRAKNCGEIIAPSHLRWLLTGENNA